MKILYFFFLLLIGGVSILYGQIDPDTAQRASIDRFSMEAGHLFIRDDSNGLPEADQPIDFDKSFFTKGFGPNGELIGYYNFDVQPTEPAPIYVLFREGEATPVEGQLNIIDVIPGDPGYNDFWEVQKVTVPADYVANTVTSFSEISSMGYAVEETESIVNCPVVPDGSTADFRMNSNDTGLQEGWYNSKVVYYFNFSEKELTVDASDMVPLSPIYVAFNINPDQEGGGPPSGFRTDMITGRTHNVAATLPSDIDYSPLWLVNVYDNADFENVHDLNTAQTSNILATGVANVNCPVVAQYIPIDRFSEAAGHLFVRDEMNGLPQPNQPINFDEMFMTKGLGPNGEFISYYNFDVQSTEQAPIYVLFREGESEPVEGQMNIINVVPGDPGYNDFWEVQKVTVPVDYVANSAKSFQDVWDAGYSIEETTILVNCPVVPEGSKATFRENSNDAGLHAGWYEGLVVYYFNFSEKELSVDASDMVPLSPIYVAFNINPDQPGGGPPSGFMKDEAGRAHNVVATLPNDADYSPLWLVNVYDNADFDNVHDLTSAQAANLLGAGIATVNCPVVASYIGIDRFSANAGHLFIRDESNGLPEPNEPVDFDDMFMTKGLGPNGEFISYYNFDVQPTEPAPIYVLFREGESEPVRDQLNLVNVIPGDPGYNDFWEVQKVTVPADYVANSARSFQDVWDAGYDIEETTILVNCPIVPDGSKATYRLNSNDSGLHKGWYEGEVVYYFNFSEKELSVDATDMVPLSPIYVAFNINPDQEGGGPASGFMKDEAGRAHNVVATLPDDEGYSPLWIVNVYDNADFDSVHDLNSALAANLLAAGVANVNCPVVANFVSIDRFSADAGNLFVRDESNGMPTPNEPVNFDEMFMTQGFGPDGEFISYYNFDVQPTVPAPIYAFFREGESMPVEGQMNIIDAVPGDPGYNDFWEVNKVSVPHDYEVNSARSFQDVWDAGYTIEPTGILVNCPVVPDGSIATKRLNSDDTGLHKGWYKGNIVYYFNFSEKELMVDGGGMVPLSPIYVTFNINPNEEGGGPPSGFKKDENGRAHNVVATLPDDEDYSPLWLVNVYDNADFENVTDLSSAVAANLLAAGIANVNCPVSEVSPATGITENSSLPLEYNLSQNYPNPFNPTTEIKFSIKANEKVSLKIFNSIGQEVAELVNRVLPAGNYTADWNARNNASGVYFYTLKTDHFNAVGKMILLK